MMKRLRPCAACNDIGTAVVARALERVFKIRFAVQVELQFRAEEFSPLEFEKWQRVFIDGDRPTLDPVAMNVAALRTNA